MPKLKENMRLMSLNNIKNNMSIACGHFIGSDVECKNCRLGCKKETGLTKQRFYNAENIDRSAGPANVHWDKVLRLCKMHL